MVLAKRLGLAFLLAIAAAGAATADTFLIEADRFVNLNNPARNYGHRPAFSVRNTSSTGYGFLKFDLAAQPLEVEDAIAHPVRTGSRKGGTPSAGRSARGDLTRSRSSHFFLFFGEPPHRRAHSYLRTSPAGTGASHA